MSTSKITYDQTYRCTFQGANPCAWTYDKSGERGSEVVYTSCVNHGNVKESAVTHSDIFDTSDAFDKVENEWWAVHDANLQANADARTVYRYRNVSVICERQGVLDVLNALTQANLMECAKLAAVRRDIGIDVTNACDQFLAALIFADHYPANGRIRFTDK